MADEFYDPSQYGPDLSRGFPGLRVWLTVKLFGAARLRAAIAEKRALAVEARRAIARIPGIVIDAPPQLSLFAFHVAWPGALIEQQNAATRELMQQVNERQHVMLTGCTVDDGRYLGRVCVLSFRTRQREIDVCIDDVTAAAASIIQAPAGRPSSR